MAMPVAKRVWTIVYLIIIVNQYRFWTWTLPNYSYYVKWTYLYIKYWLVSGGLKAEKRVDSPDPLVGVGGFTHATPDN